MGVDKHYRTVVGKKAKFTEQLLVTSSPLVVIAGSGGTPISLLNPLGADCIVTQVIIDITTALDGTPCTLDVGIGGAVIAYDTLIDGLDIATPTGAIGTRNNSDNQGDNGKVTDKWGAAEYLTVVSSASTTGMVATIYVYYRKA